MMHSTSSQTQSPRSAMPTLPSLTSAAEQLLRHWYAVFLIQLLSLLQIRSYVFDVVRGTVPKINLDDVFTVRNSGCHHDPSLLSTIALTT